MAKIKPKVYAHGCYIGNTGYNNHTRDFFRKLSNFLELKVRNFTVPKYFNGHTDEPFNKEDYLIDLDKTLLDNQAMWDGVEDNGNRKLINKPIYTNYSNDFEHNVNIILAECNHHYFYQLYQGPKIAYTVWETTKYPQSFYDRLKICDQIWVPSEWQKECSIKQGLNPDKVKVIPEAVDGNIFKPNENATLPEYNDGRFKFLIFGRWDYRKSTKELIECFLEEFGKDEPVDLVLSIDNGFAKDGFETTEERLKHYNLEDPRLKIKHFPTREEYIKYLQKGHVFLSCARSEGWNLPLIEAMACGTPSIYSNCCAQLEFAEGKGLPVKIKGTIPAIGGEYSTYSQSDLPGEFYQPDFDDLKKVMRDAYTNYKKHKKRALKESIDIRNKFTWENAAKIAYKELNHFINNLPPNNVQLTFDNGVKVEINGHHSKEYKVEFINGNSNKVEHSSVIRNEWWTACGKSYYIPWIIKINDKITHKLDLKDKTVKVSLDSKSIGDTLAWTPQVVEFQKKYKCNVALSTFHNEWFKGVEAYKDIKFIEPNTSYPSYAHYKVGWFRNDEGSWDNPNCHPSQPNTIPIIKSATDILGLPFKEINHGVNFTPKKRPIKDKYICIAPQSTAGLKEWPHSYWRELAKKIHSQGYKVVSLSLNGFKGTNIIDKSKLSWDDLFNYLYHSELLIGLGSGISWMNWALEKQTLMINNFIPYGYEFTNYLTKIENHNVCHNCWAEKDYNFDPGDWDWCPVYQGTDKQHICHKSISSEQVFNEFSKLLNL